MGTCELCGKSSESLVNIKTAGTNMNVCYNCKNMGKETEKKENKTFMFKKNKYEQTQLDVVSNSLSLINSSLAKKGINLHQLARAINVKESSLNKYFSGKIKLDLDIARKLENFFEIKLLEEIETINPRDYMQNEDDENNSSQNLSLGDLIKKQLK